MGRPRTLPTRRTTGTTARCHLWPVFIHPSHLTGRCTPATARPCCTHDIIIASARGTVMWCEESACSDCTPVTRRAPAHARQTKLYKLLEIPENFVKLPSRCELRAFTSHNAEQEAREGRRVVVRSGNKGQFGCSGARKTGGCSPPCALLGVAETAAKRTHRSRSCRSRRHWCVPRALVGNS